MVDEVRVWGCHKSDFLAVPILFAQCLTISWEIIYLLFIYIKLNFLIKICNYLFLFKCYYNYL